jgi:hypothetical protein
VGADSDVQAREGIDPGALSSADERRTLSGPTVALLGLAVRLSYRPERDMADVVRGSAGAVSCIAGRVPRTARFVSITGVPVTDLGAAVSGSA